VTGDKSKLHQPVSQIGGQVDSVYNSRAVFVQIGKSQKRRAGVLIFDTQLHVGYL